MRIDHFINRLREQAIRPPDEVLSQEESDDAKLDRERAVKTRIAAAYKKENVDVERIWVEEGPKGTNVEVHLDDIQLSVGVLAKLSEQGLVRAESIISATGRPNLGLVIQTTFPR